MLLVGMVNFKIMAKSGRIVTHMGRAILKPQGTKRSKRAVLNFDALTKIQKHAQRISTMG